MKARYWSASARIEILARSTFCWRASVSSRSSGPSKPFDVDDQRRLVGRRARREVGFEFDLVGRHDVALRAPGDRPCSAANSAARAAEIDASAAACARRAPASARARGLARQLRRRRRNRLHLVELAVAVEDDVAAGRDAPRACARRSSRTSAPMETSSLISKPSKSDQAANHVTDHCDRSRGRSDRIDGA